MQYIIEKDVGLGDLSMNMGEPDLTLIDIAKLAVKNHKDAMIDFFKTLAQKDGTIKTELQRYYADKDGHDMYNADPIDKSDEKEQIVPSSADSGIGNSYEDG